jgi:hypothetical protein
VSPQDLFRGSSAVEQVAVNHWVAGSSPALGARLLLYFILPHHIMPVKKAAIKALSRATKQRAFNEFHKIGMKKSVKELKKAVVKGT